MLAVAAAATHPTLGVLEQSPVLILVPTPNRKSLATVRITSSLITQSRTSLEGTAEAMLTQISPVDKRLSTGELIGIVIGAISAVATIVGVWVTIKQVKQKKAKNRSNSHTPAQPVAYHPITQPAAPSYPSVQTFHVAQPVYNAQPYNAQAYHAPPAYQAPAYHAVDMSWRK